MAPQQGHTVLARLKGETHENLANHFCGPRNSRGVRDSKAFQITGLDESTASATEECESD
ncbi:hypothetical protein E2C01_059234 [Portunus trituberculatus]|uniref:Uncharacterized protein n=1 Tax=Portunus trituberculatus TaxID=210409 RepID=A0A5B7H706_PORTR|nr:hypothetical protein [Portunus trituberculatus]